MISAFEQYFTSLKGKKITVLGLGVSNRPLVRLLLEFGCDVVGCDPYAPGSDPHLPGEIC